MAAIVVLLSAGVLAATTAAPGPSAVSADGRLAGAAALDIRGVDEESPTSVTTTVAPVPATPSTIPGPGPATASRPATATTVGGATTSTTTAPTSGSGVPATSSTPVGSVPAPVLGPTSWSVDKNGIRLRLRMEPAAPVAGQAVRFIVDISGIESCCATSMSIGDPQRFVPVASGGCASPTDISDVVLTHTFAKPGLYPVFLIAAGFPCQPATVVDGQLVAPSIVGADIRGCVAVGPGVAYREECR